jgi:hypothetical protein
MPGDHDEADHHFAALYFVWLVVLSYPFEIEKSIPLGAHITVE